MAVYFDPVAECVPDRSHVPNVRLNRLRVGARLTLLVLCLLWPLLATAQPGGGSNPCTDTPADSTAANPKVIYAVLPDHARISFLDNVTPMIIGYELRTYAAIGTDIASDPIHTVEIPKANWTLASTAGTEGPEDDCYTTPMPAAPVFGVNIRYISRLVAKGSPSHGDSPESQPSNPFGLTSPPRVGVVRVR